MHGDGIITWPDGKLFPYCQVVNILVVTDMIRSMDMAFLSGETAENTEVIG